MRVGVVIGRLHSNIVNGTLSGCGTVPEDSFGKNGQTLEACSPLPPESKDYCFIGGYPCFTGAFDSFKRWPDNVTGIIDHECWSCEVERRLTSGKNAAVRLERMSAMSVAILVVVMVAVMWG